MRTTPLLSVLLLFLLVHASITRAQTVNLTGTVSLDQDYRTVNFNSPNGQVKVILPGDLSGPGQGSVLLSGTVITEPTGKTEKEKSGNLKALQKMLLSIAGNSIPVLPGQNPFSISVPASSTKPVPVEMATSGGKKATVLLQNPVISPPPMSGNIPSGESALFTDQKAMLTSGNIPVYAANYTSTQFQPSDKFYFKSASGNMTEAVRLAQSPTQTVLSAQGIQPGTTTIVRQSPSRTDRAEVRMVNVTLSTPNTNLRKGQTSPLTVSVDPIKAEKSGVGALPADISIDVRNLSPGVIEMAGGNMQVIHFPTTPGSTAAAAWQTTKTIVGLTPGEFNVSATLYPSSEIADPFEAQLDALKTVAEFKRWRAGIRRDLDAYIKKTGNGQDQLKAVAQYVKDNMPVCHSEEELGISKWAADYLLNFLPELKRTYVNGASAFAAYEAASNRLISQAGKNPDFVHTDIIQNGLELIGNAKDSMNDPNLKQQLTVAKNAAVTLDRNYSAQNVSSLATALSGLNATPLVSGLVTSSFYSIGWSFSCDDCLDICKKSNKVCDLGVHFYEVPIDGKNFKDDKGNSWRKKRKFKFECKEEVCYNLWGDKCCAYRITTDAVEIEGEDFWEVGKPGATGTTWGPPPESIPCTCGTLYDILQRVHASALLQGLSWQERVDKLESQLKLYCPGLTTGNLPGMAKHCGFPGADKELTGVSGHDIMNWLEGLLEGMFHTMHGK